MSLPGDLTDEQVPDSPCTAGVRHNMQQTEKPLNYREIATWHVVGMADTNDQLNSGVYHALAGWTCEGQRAAATYACDCSRYSLHGCTEHRAGLAKSQSNRQSPRHLYPREQN